MATFADALENVVPVSEFSRGGAARAFAKAQGAAPVIVMKNNRPLAVITSPEEYTRLSQVEEDFVLLSESIMRLARNDTMSTVPFETVLDEFELSPGDLDSFEEIEIG